MQGPTVMQNQSWAKIRSADDVGRTPWSQSRSVHSHHRQGRRGGSAAQWTKSAHMSTYDSGSLICVCDGREVLTESWGEQSDGVGSSVTNVR